MMAVRKDGQQGPSCTVREHINKRYTTICSTASGDWTIERSIAGEGVLWKGCLSFVWASRQADIEDPGWVYEASGNYRICHNL